MAVKVYVNKKNEKTWYVEIYLGRDETGKKIIYKKRGFTKKGEALVHENEILYKQ